MNLADFYKNKVVLITGASMGIGKTLALKILQFGGKVTITGRNEERLLSVQKEFAAYAGNLLIHTGHVAEFESNATCVEKTVQRFGKLDILINNAGISNYFSELEFFTEQVVNEVIDTNLKGAVFATIAAIAELKKSKGAILFVSSIAAFRGVPAFSIYSLSKMALTSLAQSMRLEYKNTGIFIGIAYVGFTENDLEKRALSCDGTPKKIPSRNKLVTKSQLHTANIILKQIAKRKNKVIHSLFGKAIFLLCQHFPAAAKLLYSRIYKKQKNIMCAD